MKKILFAILLMIFSFGISNAQQVKKSTATAPATTSAVSSKSTTSTQPGKKKVTSHKRHLKKDGTPDKRFKENKAKATAGPAKKDGTPDMRYKANKKKN